MHGRKIVIQEYRGHISIEMSGHGSKVEKENAKQTSVALTRWAIRALYQELKQVNDCEDCPMFPNPVFCNSKIVSAIQDELEEDTLSLTEKLHKELQGVLEDTFKGDEEGKAEIEEALDKLFDPEVFQEQMKEYLDGLREKRGLSEK